MYNHWNYATNDEFWHHHFWPTQRLLFLKIYLVFSQNCKRICDATSTKTQNKLSLQKCLYFFLTFWSTAITKWPAMRMNTQKSRNKDKRKMNTYHIVNVLHVLFSSIYSSIFLKLVSQLQLNLIANFVCEKSGIYTIKSLALTVNTINHIDQTRRVDKCRFSSELISKKIIMFLFDFGKKKT